MLIASGALLLIGAIVQQAHDPRNQNRMKANSRELTAPGEKRPSCNSA